MTALASCVAISRPPFVDVTNAAQTVMYNTTATAVGGSNNASVVALWWTNALTGARGTVALGSPWWTVGGISLGVGANPITVSGTNALGVSSSGSVTITRADATTGLPFVDITNQTPFADITLPFMAAGTNNESVVGSMWISNGANGQAVSFPASQAWTSAAVDLMAFTNMIYVFGSNAVRNVTNDTIVVIGIPEVGLGCGVVLLALAMRRRRSS